MSDPSKPLRGEALGREVVRLRGEFAERGENLPNKVAAQILGTSLSAVEKGVWKAKQVDLSALVSACPDAATSESDFESIKRVDDLGEWWDARELRLLMDYTRYEQFEDVIKKAKISCARAKQEVGRHFQDFLRQGDLGVAQQSVRLSRFGAYLVAMNGDVNKDPVALAQTYFAQQEVARMEAAGVAVEPWEADMNNNPLTVLFMKTVEVIRDQARVAYELKLTQKTQDKHGRLIDETQAALAVSQARINAIEGQSEWYAAVAYAEMRGFVDTTNKAMARFGRIASRLCRENRFEPRDLPHPVFVTIGGYPLWILRQAESEYAPEYWSGKPKQLKPELEALTRVPVNR